MVPFLLALYEIATYLSNDAYLPALPKLAQCLNATNHLAQLTLTAWFLGSGAMQLFLGPLTDQVGRRPVLLTGGLIFIVVTIGCALTSNIYILLVFRFVQGAAIASMYIPGYATIHELFEQKQAIRILAIMASITILAPAFGPLLGAFVLIFADWRWIFGILAIWGVVAIVGLFFKMPETKITSNETISLHQAVTQYRKIISNRRFMLFALMAQSFFAAMIAWIAAGPFLVMREFHFSTVGFGILQGSIFTSFILTSILVKRLMQKIQLLQIVKIAILLFFLGGSYALLCSIIWQKTLTNIIIAMILMAGGTGLAFPVLNRLAIESSPERMGSRIAIFSCLLGIASTVVSAVISVVYDNTLLSLAMVLFVLGILPPILFFSLGRLTPSKPTN
jgi:Bcr/CflA subfamily drug resistance transporter